MFALHAICAVQGSAVYVFQGLEVVSNFDYSALARIHVMSASSLVKSAIIQRIMKQRKTGHTRNGIYPMKNLSNKIGNTRPLNKRSRSHIGVFEKCFSGKSSI